MFCSLLFFVLVLLVPFLVFCVCVVCLVFLPGLATVSSHCALVGVGDGILWRARPQPTGGDWLVPSVCVLNYWPTSGPFLLPPCFILVALSAVWCEFRTSCYYLLSNCSHFFLDKFLLGFRLFERSEFLIDTSQKKSLRVCTCARVPVCPCARVK